MGEYIEREKVMDALLHEQYGYLCEDAINAIPAADVPSALWTDEPISGTEFMTHNQGQSGFEIHFRTDDKAKYEAVQNECRRQIDHAKPAADVRPVIRAHWEYRPTSHHDHEWYCSACGRNPWWCGITEEVLPPYCPWCGAEMIKGAE